jgi:hypothetical protein
MSSPQPECSPTMALSRACRAALTSFSKSLDSAYYLWLNSPRETRGDSRSPARGWRRIGNHFTVHCSKFTILGSPSRPRWAIFARCFKLGKLPNDPKQSNPVKPSQSESNPVKPGQAESNPVRRLRMADGGLPPKRAARSKPVKASQSQSNPVKPPSSLDHPHDPNTPTLHASTTSPLHPSATAESPTNRLARRGRLRHVSGVLSIL